ncbi:MAG TPA: Gfo/Idh/MocA family oxidoreductase [Planctomycetota bacterium]|nr:Gfo/Idh/MocA family oxidoreductase [Planctomycetota bacterium]
MSTSNFSRRNFLKTSAAAAACLWGASSRVLGANEDIRIGMIGFRGRGKDHIENLRKLKGVRIVTLCDVDADVLGAEAKKFADRGEKVETCSDVRKLLEDKNIDAIASATPNHWHSLLTVWACQAGKDVYMEKPISHNVWEGRKAVEAARKYNRIVQAGTQSRSNPGLREAVEFIQKGGIGKVKLVRGLCYKPRNSIGKVPGEQTVPSSIDYDLWTGPAEKLPLTRKSLHYDWHWVWNTGNGDLGNQGIHQMDIARWILGENELSPKVLSIGGRLGYVDDGQTPNTQIIYHAYAKTPLLFEVRGLSSKPESKEMDNYRGAQIGVIAHGEEGEVVMPSYAIAIVYDKSGKEVKRFGETTNAEGKKTQVQGNHYENFINAVRSRKSTDLHADIIEGHLSSALCHTGNISHLTGKPAVPEEVRDAVKSNAELAEVVSRVQEHLGNHKIDLSSEKITLGSWLTMDPKTERFAGNAVANALLTREYRKGFEVPEKV